MAIEILENKSVDITNIAGAVFNNFAAGGRDGIIGGYANLCGLSNTGNRIIISTGQLLIRGVRLNITDIEEITMSSAPQVNTRYQIIVQLSRNGDTFSASIFARAPAELQQDDIINGDGVYQFELGRFTHDTSGNVTDVIRTADIIYGGHGGGSISDFEIGEVTTETLDPGLNAEVDIDKQIVNGKTVIDFKFSLPHGEHGQKGDPSTVDKIGEPSVDNGTIEIDLSDIQDGVYKTIDDPLVIDSTAEVTFTGLNLPSGYQKTVKIYIKRTEDVSVTWDNIAAWANNAIPLLPVGMVCEIFVETSNGVNYYGKEGDYWDVQE